MRSAFVSHSTADDSFVAEMESFLRAAGFEDVFNAVHAIMPDEQFWPRIEQGITDCDTFVVVITAAATNSEWVKREVALARRLGKRIIPVWREDCPLPPDFTDRDVIDFRTRARKERRIDIDRILKYAPAELIGREAETKLLTDAWQQTLRLEKCRPRVLTFVALGGEGKTSLVAKWAAELAGQDWPGCDAAFAWSFYSQGTREQLAASSDLFLKEALTFFGDATMAGSAAGAFDKGRRLAQLVGERRALLILDGLEPLQYAPTAPTPGELKDQGVAALLKGLAAASHGLCVVTTRYSLPDLRAFWPAHPSPSGRGAGGEGTACEVKLLRLSRDAGVHLLKTLGVSGAAQEFATLVEDVKGHALTLTLLGGFLKRAFHGDIRQRDRVKFEKADEKMDGGHAFWTMAAYEQWLLRDGGDEGRREVAVLRLMGLFDRPADAGCLAALRRETIPGLTEPLAGLADDDWEYCLSGLEAVKLLTVNRDASGTLVSLDAHPHLREYFARQLRTQHHDAWRAAHRRLYEHLCATTLDKPQPTLEDLQPLYQAVAHGCQAGLFEAAWKDVYYKRIRREETWYSGNHLGAFNTDLAAAAGFFETYLTAFKDGVPASIRHEIAHDAAVCLRTVSLVLDARKTAEFALILAEKAGDLGSAARCARFLAGNALTLGDIDSTRSLLEKALGHATASGSVEDIIAARVTMGVALHQQGRQLDALPHFNVAESLIEQSVSISSRRKAELSLWCQFRKSDCQSSDTERAVWKNYITREAAINHQPMRSDEVGSDLGIETPAPTVVAGPLYLAFAQSTEVRDLVATAVLQARRDLLPHAKRLMKRCVDNSRKGNRLESLPIFLLQRAWLRALTGALTGPESTQADLDEAWEIAERGPMKLHMADIHLYRARLFGSWIVDSGSRMEEVAYPWTSPQHDLAEARRLIEQCGYWRRKEELEDAEGQLMGFYVSSSADEKRSLLQ
ncbi:MAG: TIR domain-containing protein [Verrucomicrobia bacterium]|nr:TIR domain-containing protein [Verrucomicrobiota bacterium]